MRSCVCFTCPLSSSHQSDMTFSSTERNVEPELPWFIDAATPMSSPCISCDTPSSQLKIPQRLRWVPRVNLTQKPFYKLPWLKCIGLSFQEALVGMTACRWCWGVAPTSHHSHPSQPLGKMEHMFLPQSPPCWCLVWVMGAPEVHMEQ